MMKWVMIVMLLAGMGMKVEAQEKSGGERIPVILDTDIGDDIDDTWALGMLLGSPQIDLKLVVTATGNTPAKTRLVAKILEGMGRTDVPVGTGIQNGTARLNQAQWLGDYKIEHFPGKVKTDGVGALIEAINAAKTTVTLCVLGPQTNIREALRRDPGIARKARVVAMAGSIYVGYDGNKKGRDAEYNVKVDVAAAQAVMAAPWSITIAPLDSCGLLRLGGERFAKVAASTAPRAKTVIENYNQWANRKGYAAGESSVLFDVEAACLCRGEGAEALLEMKTVKLRVDNQGFTVPDEGKGRPVSCALAFKDRAGLEELLVGALTGK